MLFPHNRLKFTILNSEKWNFFPFCQGVWRVQGCGTTFYQSWISYPAPVSCLINTACFTRKDKNAFKTSSALTTSSLSLSCPKVIIKNFIMWLNEQRTISNLMVSLRLAGWLHDYRIFLSVSLVDYIPKSSFPYLPFLPGSFYPIEGSQSEKKFPIAALDLAAMPDNKVIFSLSYFRGTPGYFFSSWQVNVDPGQVFLFRKVLSLRRPSALFFGLCK